MLHTRDLFSSAHDSSSVSVSCEVRDTEVPYSSDSLIIYFQAVEAVIEGVYHARHWSLLADSTARPILNLECPHVGVLLNFVLRE